jgi:hypothetical protein
VRTRNRDLFLRFQDVFADQLRTLVDEIKEVRASAAGADQDGEAQAGTRLRIDAIGLTNRITAWLGRREEARSARAAAASDQQRKGKGKKKKEKKEGKKKRVKQAEVLVQTSDIEVVDDDEDEGGLRDGDDSDSDDGEAEVAELRDMLTRELVRQARAVTGWRRTDQWFAEERPQQHREGAADEAEAEAQPLEAMVELLRQLRAIPSDPVVELFAHERRLALLRRAEGGHDQERGKWGRPKLRCDPRVEYVIPGTSIDKDHYEVSAITVCRVCRVCRLRLMTHIHTYMCNSHRGSFRTRWTSTTSTTCGRWRSSGAPSPGWSACGRAWSSTTPSSTPTTSANASNSRSCSRTDFDRILIRLRPKLTQ